MKNLLFIAYLFPPLGGAPSIACFRLIKHLTPYDCNIIVLTTEPGPKAYHKFENDESLRKELEKYNIKIIRIKSFEPKSLLKVMSKLGLARLIRLFFIPDVMICWVIPAVIKALNIIKQNKIDIMITTSSPWSVHLIGLILTYFKKIPWIAHFRDTWTQGVIRDWPTKLHYKIEETMEKAVYKNAAKIILITPSTRERLHEKYKMIPSSKTATIPIGYDEEDFRNQNKIHKHKKFILSYIGRFYGIYKKERTTHIPDIITKFLKYRSARLNTNACSPYYIFLGLQKLIAQHPEIKADLELRIVGTLHNENSALVDEFSLGDIVNITGYVSHSECINMILESSALVYILWDSDKPVCAIRNKLYEYIAAKRPILALVPDGDSKDLIKAYGHGIFARPANADEIAEKMYQLYKKWKNNALFFEANDEFIKQFELKKLTKQLVSIIDQIYSKTAA